MDVSNARPLAIFVGYMTTAAALTITCIIIIANGAAIRNLTRITLSRRRAKAKPDETQHRNDKVKRNLAFPVYCFSLLAALSLFTTWYHMFCFFKWSYDQWKMDKNLADPSQVYLGDWLRDTKLFRQAWASTLETPSRTFWSLPIFGFCAILSVMLAAQGRKKSIPHTWIFMLLGQVVAISFASNLFFIAILFYDIDEPAKDKDEADGESTTSSLSAPSWYDPIIGVTIAIAVNIPLRFEHPKFMYLLLAPHLLAFLPVVLNRLLPGKAPSYKLDKPGLGTQFGVMLFLSVVGTTFLVSEVKKTAGAPLSISETISRSLSLIGHTLYDHPAVSSVGWDVICCWISYAVWAIQGVQ